MPDAFVGQRQAGPLDLYDSAFFTRRKTAILDRLTWLEAAEEQDLAAEVAAAWESHFEEKIVGTNWDLFDSAQDAAVSATVHRIQ